MLEVKISAVTFRRVFDAIKELVSESNIEFSEQGMQLQTLDSSHVALVHVQLKCEGFFSYRCDKDRTIGVPISTLCKVLKVSDKDDVLTLKCADSHEENSDHLGLSFVSNNAEQKADFNLKLMNIDQESLTIPETEYPDIVVMSSAAFQRICRDLEAFGETVTIECKKDCVSFSTSGLLGSVNLTRQASSDLDEEKNILSIVCGQGVKKPYSFKFISVFAKAAPLSGNVTLCLSDDMPLLVEFSLPESTGFVRFYLAPKLCDEEMN